MPLMNAQEVRTNADGEKIIVYPDGSWKYFDEANRQSYETEANTEDLETQERNKAIQQAEKANAEAKALERLAEDATLQRLFLEEDYHFFINTNPDATDEDIKAKKQLITDAKKIENKAKKKAEEAKETAEDQEKLIYMSSKKRKKYLAKLADKQNEAIDSSKEKSLVSFNLMALMNSLIKNVEKSFLHCFSQVHAKPYVLISRKKTISNVEAPCQASQVA